MSAPPAVSADTVLPPPQPGPSTKPRMLYIDNLRIVLISMVMLLHLAITYGATGD
jgi:peptidoglycan/LPS O-acetylase OafA/YrhL